MDEHKGVDKRGDLFTPTYSELKATIFRALEKDLFVSAQEKKECGILYYTMGLYQLEIHNTDAARRLFNIASDKYGNPDAFLQVAIHKWLDGDETGALFMFEICASGGNKTASKFLAQYYEKGFIPSLSNANDSLDLTPVSEDDAREAVDKNLELGSKCSLRGMDRLASAHYLLAAQYGCRRGTILANYCPISFEKAVKYYQMNNGRIPDRLGNMISISSKKRSTDGLLAFAKKPKL